MAKKIWPTARVVRQKQIGFQSSCGLTILEIAREETVAVSITRESDDGYHRYGNDWWSQAACPTSFKYLAIDALYPDPYFDGHGHPDPGRAVDLVDYMQTTYKRVFGQPFRSILELGSGGGEITRVFAERGFDFLAVEGTAAGVRRLQEIGIPSDRIQQHNLKFMPGLQRTFDIVMCTEVAEHIEPFFASKVVENCIAHADAVWFSAADRNRRAHYHHINEQPIEVWDNLFAHMGCNRFVELDGRYGRASRLYLRSK